MVKLLNFHISWSSQLALSYSSFYLFFTTVRKPALLLELLGNLWMPQKERQKWALINTTGSTVCVKLQKEIAHGLCSYDEKKGQGAFIFNLLAARLQWIDPWVERLLLPHLACKSLKVFLRIHKQGTEVRSQWPWPWDCMDRWTDNLLTQSLWPQLLPVCRKNR